MCINCNMLSPLSDVAADYLGVERRKYLVVGRQTYDLPCVSPFVRGFSNAVYNFRTLAFFVPPTNPPTIEVKGVSLYEGKIKVMGPLPLEYKCDEDPYAELFDGELTWVDNPPVPQPDMNTGIANVYRQKPVIEAS